VRALERLAYDLLCSLPPCEFGEATKDERRYFCEDILQFERRDGTIVDVGWHDRGKEFICSVLKEAKPEAWVESHEEMRTSSTRDVRRWLIEKLRGEF
jgi:hypothetical protein